MDENKEKRELEIWFRRREKEGKEDRDRGLARERSTERDGGKKEKKEKGRTKVGGNSIFPLQFFMSGFSQ